MLSFHQFMMGLNDQGRDLYTAIKKHDEQSVVRILNSPSKPAFSDVRNGLHRPNLIILGSPSPVIVSELLQAYAAEMSVDYKNYALDHAIGSGNLKIVQLLAFSGVQNDDVLENAARQGKVDIVQWLLNPESGVEISGMCKGQALLNSVRGNHIDVVRLLLADPHGNDIPC